MGRIKRILQKIAGGGSNSEARPRVKISPNEAELMYFKEQERKDLIKKELNKYRKKEALLNTTNWNKKLGERPIDISKAKSIFKTPQPPRATNILNAKSALTNDNILKVRRLF